MRKVKVKIRGSKDGGKTVEEFYREGMFHTWVVINYPSEASDVMAVIEFEEGKIELHNCYHVEFTDGQVFRSFL